MVLFGTAVAGGGQTKPTFSCTVDGAPAKSDPRATGEAFACAWQGEDGGGTHTFLLNATIPQGSGSASPSLSIDSLWFQPASDSSLSDDKALVMYDHNDPHIDFSGEWEPLSDPDGSAVAATQAGSFMSVVFTGKPKFYASHVQESDSFPSSRHISYLGRLDCYGAWRRTVERNILDRRSSTCHLRYRRP
jgi:hypothetical protein